MDKDETNDSFAVHNFVNAGRSVWSGITQAAEAGAKSLAETGEVRSITQKIAMVIRNKVSKIAGSRAMKSSLVISSCPDFVTLHKLFLSLS